MAKVPTQFLILLFLILFAISATILVIASTVKTPIPAWGGYLDVAIVVLIAVTGFALHQRDQGAPRYDMSHQVAVYLFPLIVVGMWVFRDALDFNILLPGVAWRTYFLLSILPHALSLWKPRQTQ
jgi:hypothetical protein